MKQTAFSLLIAGLLVSTFALAQTGPTSGKITYEGMRRVDPSQMRMVNNGQEVRPRRSADQMNEIRRKAMADFRQKNMNAMPFPGRNYE